VKKHNVQTDCWIVVHGQVLDVTNFLADHPGGAQSILAYAGKDASAEYDMVHPPGIMAKHASNLVVGRTQSDAGDQGSEKLPALAWCPCCRQPLKGTVAQGGVALAHCKACGIKVSIERSKQVN